MSTMRQLVTKYLGLRKKCHLPVNFSILKKEGLVEVSSPQHGNLTEYSTNECQITTNHLPPNSSELLQCLDRDSYILKIELLDEKDEKKEFYGKLNWLNKAFENISQPFLIDLKLMNNSYSVNQVVH
ncbi:MAG: hypothetical protein ACE5FU_15020 [Nitrospinota bacterium]